jgi:hypothetical protein
MAYVVRVVSDLQAVPEIVKGKVDGHPVKVVSCELDELGRVMFELWVDADSDSRATEVALDVLARRFAGGPAAGWTAIVDGVLDWSPAS